MSRGTKKEGSSSYVGFSPKSRVPSPILQKKRPQAFMALRALFYHLNLQSKKSERSEHLPEGLP